MKPDHSGWIGLQNANYPGLRDFIATIGCTPVPSEL